MASANRTAFTAQDVHGTNPQFLIDKIVRLKVYQCSYYNEKCFALTAESIIDEATELQSIGGCHGGIQQPSEFLCLVVKLLQIQPEITVIDEYLAQTEFKYL